jgi:serine/alanine adding enzyme
LIEGGIGTFSGYDDAVGVLPLVHLSHLLFSKHLISIPNFDLGGLLAYNGEPGESLLHEALPSERETRLRDIEVCSHQAIEWMEGAKPDKRAGLGTRRGPE